jgi:glutamine amidotransferase
MICVIDYGLGNLRAICNMLRRLDIPAAASSRPEEIASAGRLILPGVGAFDRGMANLRERGIEPIIHERVMSARVPVLGVCLGMQLMGRTSEEGNAVGLGWIDASSVHLRRLSPSGGAALTIPHTRWNTIDIHPERSGHPLITGLPPDPRFYFVHSYAVRCNEARDEVASTAHGDIRFTSVFAHGNIAGVQFHPEKSHRFGMSLLRNFARWSPE